MKHYLKALKQKNSLLFSVGIVMLLVLTLCLSGCSEKNEVQDQTNGADTIPNQSASAEETSLDKGTQRKTTENELPSLTQCTA